MSGNSLFALLSGGSYFADRMHADLAESGRASGAMVSGDELVIATVEQVRPDRFQLIEEGSIALRLQNRSQRATQKFADDVRRWASTSPVERLALRMGPIKGRVTQAPPAFKIEAVLQLLTFLDVQVVDTGAVGNWIKAEDPEFTDVFRPGRTTAAQKLLRAMEMAGFAIRHRNDSRFFPGGWDA